MKRLALILFSVYSVMPSNAQHLSATNSAEGTAILDGDSNVLFYQAKPKSLNGKYERADYIHPLYSLDGSVLTEDFPQDHLHHRGIFWAWHQIIYRGKHIADAWSCENISWHVVKSEVQKKKGSITLDNDVIWKSVLDDGKQTGVVREKSQVTIYNAHNDYRIVDFDIRLTPLLDDMRIGGSDDAKGYSGFSVRLKLPDDIRFLSGDQELKAQELALKAGPWLDFRGSFDGKNAPESGVALFCHPSNPGYPEPWIIRSEKSMQNAAFPGREPVALPKAGWRLQYRLIIHKNTVTVERLQHLFDEYRKSKK
ncbi:MAG TPA: DUF6807 family protein [Chryseosolibacter sp.]